MVAPMRRRSEVLVKAAGEGTLGLKRVLGKGEPGRSWGTIATKTAKVVFVFADRYRIIFFKYAQLVKVFWRFSFLLRRQLYRFKIGFDFRITSSERTPAIGRIFLIPEGQNEGDNLFIFSVDWFFILTLILKHARIRMTLNKLMV